MKKYSIVVFWILIYGASIGFILPYLFSAKSYWTIALGILLVILLVYKLIFLFNSDTIKKFLNKQNNEK